MTNQVKNYFKMYGRDYKGLKKTTHSNFRHAYVYVCTYVYITHLNKSCKFTFTLRIAIYLAWWLNLFKLML